MIESLIWVAILFGPGLLEAIDDPGLGLFANETTTRQHDCTQIDLEAARSIRPDKFQDRSPRGDFVNRDAFLCREAILAPEVRSQQHTRMFDTLSAKVQRLARVVSSRFDTSTVVMLETHHNDSIASEKISFAAKVALIESGLNVSDHRPMLPATELGVIGRLPHYQAHALSCQRLTDLKKLIRGEALIRIIVANENQTELFAGVCTVDGWSWLP